MGQVWTARHSGLGRRVAIKFVDAGSPQLEERLLREAQVLASVRHPAIVEVYDCGTGEELGPYVAMELVEGETLSELIARGPLQAERAVRLFLALLDGLEALHRAGIVHRDVKPANLLVCGEQAKLIDLGIAYVARSGKGRLTQDGGVLGTPAYMAPEQVRAQGVDQRADVWAVALTLIEAITGEPVFDAPDPTAILAKVLTTPVARPPHPAIDDALWSLLAQATEQDPAARLGSAVAFKRGLEEWLAARARPPAQGSSPPRAAEPPPSLDALILGAFKDT